MYIEAVMPSNHLILCCPLFLKPSIYPSIRVFSTESVLRIRWPKYLSFSFSIGPSNGYAGLISVRIYWFDLLAVQGTLTRWAFVGKVMSLLFSMLSRLGIAFLPWSKCLLISCLHSPSAIILEPQNIKSATVSAVSPWYIKFYYVFYPWI